MLCGHFFCPSNNYSASHATCYHRQSAKSLNRSIAHYEEDGFKCNLILHHHQIRFRTDSVLALALDIPEQRNTEFFNCSYYGLEYPKEWLS